MIEKNISRTCWGFFFRNIKATWTPCRAASWHEEAWDCLLLALPLSDPHSSMIKILGWIHLDWFKQIYLTALQRVGGPLQPFKTPVINSGTQFFSYVMRID